jgi:RND family efflux transporter MFP subunit
MSLFLLAHCRQQDTRAKANSTEAIQVAKENIVRVEAGRLISGPVISGEIQAERSATVRARVGGTIVQVNVKEGQNVHTGDLLARIDSQTLQDTRNSARAAVQATQHSLELARVEVTRDEGLVAAGAIAQRELDQARSTAAAVETQLANAQAALQNAEQQLRDTTLLSPFTGIVSRLEIHQGDVVASGAELLTLIDPASMRLSASATSGQIGEIQIGNPVEFTIRGYDDVSKGTIARIAPETDPVTRQVQVYVALPDTSRRLKAGLFADGRIVTRSEEGTIVPDDALIMGEGRVWVLRVRNGVAERVDVVLGLRDNLTERAIVRGELSAGDALLRGTAQAISPGTPVQLEE